MFASGFSMKPEKFSKFETIQIKWLAEHASKKKAHITGSIIAEENGNYFNRLIWMNPNGKFKFYDKRHLFSFAGENMHYCSGKQILTVQINNFRIRPLICYDLRFPVWSRNQNDYDVLIYIANWPERRRDAWKTLLKARAIENQCYVIGVNRVGEDGNAINHTGDSELYDPKGKILSTFIPGKEMIETFNLDLNELIDFREKFPVGKDADRFSIHL
jgi:predicted amidohydrolase